MEVWADEILSIGDEFTGARTLREVASAKLRTDNRKWLLARLHAEKYGDRLQVKW